MDHTHRLVKTFTACISHVCFYMTRAKETYIINVNRTAKKYPAMCADNKDSEQPEPTTLICLHRIIVTLFAIWADNHAQALFITCLIKLSKKYLTIPLKGETAVLVSANASYIFLLLLIIIIIVSNNL